MADISLEMLPDLKQCCMCLYVVGCTMNIVHCLTHTRILFVIYMIHVVCLHYVLRCTYVYFCGFYCVLPLPCITYIAYNVCCLLFGLCMMYEEMNNLGYM